MENAFYNGMMNLVKRKNQKALLALARANPKFSALDEDVAPRLVFRGESSTSR